MTSFKVLGATLVLLPRSLRRPPRHGRRSRSPPQPQPGPDLLHLFELFEQWPRIFAYDGLAGTARRRVGTAYVRYGGIAESTHAGLKRY